MLNKNDKLRLETLIAPFILLVIILKITLSGYSVNYRTNDNYGNCNLNLDNENEPLIELADKIVNTIVAKSDINVLTYKHVSDVGYNRSATHYFTECDKPEVTFSGLDDACLNAPPFLLSGGLPVGGIYSGPGISNNIFDPMVAGAGEHLLTYTFTDSLGCSAFDTSTIRIVDLPVVNLAVFGSYCINIDPFELKGGLPEGGTYSGSGIVNNKLYPITAGVGEHLITYTYADATGCANFATANIVFVPVPDMLCVNNFEVFKDDSPVTLSGGQPEGGVYSGTGVSNGVFDPATAGVGEHVVTYTYINSYGCTSFCIFNINVSNSPSPLELSVNLIQNVSCYGGNNGIAEVVATGGVGNYRYRWTPTGQTTAIATRLTAGAYTVTVTDERGVSASSSITITQPTLIELMVTNINPSVSGYADGSATVQATGGTPPYTYLWSDGQTTATAANLTAGTYTVVITDANGCVVSGEVTITDPILSYTLTVETSPGGLVHVNGFDYENPMTFYHGNMPEVLALPDEGWQFDGWSGNLSGTDNPDYLFMDDNKTVTATFSEIQPENYTLEVIIEGNGHVLVNGQTYTETLTFTDGTELLVEAIPEVDWVFKRWEGDINSNDSLITLLMNSNKDLVAVFSEKPLYSVSFAIKDEVGEPIHDAYINFNGVNYPPSMYTFGGLKQGNYPYIVLRSGYFNTQGAVQITNVDVTLSVVLNKDNTLVRAKETRSLKMYPNPAKDNVIIESEEPILQISVLNAMGQLLHVETINGEQHVNFNLPNLNDGVYLLHILGKESLNTKLLLIEK